ncbi:hypothetical protein CEB3_c25860 [Peptococcaceae bacterium CEB3]|nr:hypothetical protein CEB3_c25860 [Peptococcaceae bacterium CEB3]
MVTLHGPQRAFPQAGAVHGPSIAVLAVNYGSKKDQFVWSFLCNYHCYILRGY